MTERNNDLVSHAGPALLPLIVVHAALLAASLAAGALLRHGTAFVTPYAPPEAVRQFFATNQEAVRASAFCFFASFVPLGIFAATIVSRLRFLGVRAAGTYIALFGGFTASLMIALSGIFSWVLSVPEVSTSQPLTQGLYFLSFLFGGAGFAVCFGLLIAGVSVTSHFNRLLSKPVVAFGLLIALAGELSTLGLLIYPANFTIPITRFGGIIWLIIVAATLSKTRPRTRVGVAAAK